MSPVYAPPVRTLTVVYYSGMFSGKYRSSVLVSVIVDKAVHIVLDLSGVVF